MKLLGRRTDSLLLVGYLVLAVLFHWGLVIEGKILADFDAFVYFYPIREYAARALAEGRLPLWNPHLFFGAPFLANPQSAVLYPPNLLFNLLAVPTAYGLALVLHVFLAGASFHLFARHTLALGPAGAALGSLAYMFSGFLGGQSGHLNQLQAAAWLPLLVVIFDRALARQSLALAAGAGAVLAVQLLAGHPQESYLSLVVLALLALWRALEPGLRPAGPTLRRLAGSLALLALTAGAGLGLAAVQLLPTVELSAASIRGGGLEYADAVANSLPPNQLHRSLLPGFWENPCCERSGYVGVLPLVLALIGVGARAHRLTGLLVALALLSLFLAFGGANPLYPLLFKIVPGLGSFRVPARWLLPYTFAVASLAAIGLDWLARTPASPIHGRMRLADWWQLAASLGRGFWLRFLAVGGAAALAFAVLQTLDRVPNRMVAAWAALAALSLLLAGLALERRRRPAALAVLLAAATVELWLAGSPLPQRAPIPDEAFVAARDSTLFIQGHQRGDRVLSIASENYEIKETPDYRVWFGDLPARSLLNFMIAQKYNEILMPNVPSLYGLDSADGYDGGVLPLRSFVRFSELFIPADQVRPDGVWQSRIDTLPPPRLLDLINVGQVLTGRIKDTRVDGVELDRAITLRLRPGERREITLTPVVATSVAILAAVEGQLDAPTGTPLLRLSLSGEAAASQDLELRWGEHLFAAGQKPNESRPAAERWKPSEGWDTLARLPVSRASVARLAVQNRSPTATIRISAITLIDQATGQYEPLVLDDTFERTRFFDMKVYEYRDVLPRAYVVHEAVVLPDGEALARMKADDFTPRRTVVLAPGDGAEALGPTGPSAPPSATATVLSYEPERVTVRTELAAPGYLVLSDTWFPGWRARVDGRPAPLLRADLLFRAVPLSPGSHTVEFVYEPESLRLGLMISAITGVLVLAVVWLAQRAARGRRPTAPNDQPREGSGGDGAGARAPGRGRSGP